MQFDQNPFVESDDATAADTALALAAGRGDRLALEALFSKHQKWVYNIAVRMVLNPDDALEISQEAMVRVLCRIGQFEGRSSFKTWAYRIVVNCFLDAKRKPLETFIGDFDTYGEQLESLGLDELRLPAELEPERQLIVEDAKVGCMLGMLLCLSREQRIVYILGEVFTAPSNVAAGILGMTGENFRKQLQRARQDLTSFMNDRCGLINTKNACRCERKTQAFIRAGWVDPGNRKFVPIRLESAKAQAPRLAAELDHLVEDRYATLFRAHPAFPGERLEGALEELVEYVTSHGEIAV